MLKSCFRARMPKNPRRRRRKSGNSIQKLVLGLDPSIGELTVEVDFLERGLKRVTQKSRKA